LNIISNKTLAEQHAEREKKIADQQKANMLNWMGVKPNGKQ
jgi:hypothetical protein